MESAPESAKCFRTARGLKISSADLSYLQSVDLSHALQILPTECMEHGVMMRHSLFTLSMYKYCQDHRSKVSLSQDSWRQSWHEKQLYCSQYSLTNDTSQYYWSDTTVEPPSPQYRRSQNSQKSDGIREPAVKGDNQENPWFGSWKWAAVFGRRRWTEGRYWGGRLYCYDGMRDSPGYVIKIPLLKTHLWVSRNCALFKYEF